MHTTGWQSLLFLALCLVEMPESCVAIFKFYLIQTVYIKLCFPSHHLPHISLSLSLPLPNLTVVLPALVDRLGDGKDQVRENSQALILRCMEHTASPMVRHTYSQILVSGPWADKDSVSDKILGESLFEM